MNFAARMQMMKPKAAKSGSASSGNGKRSKGSRARRLRALRRANGPSPQGWDVVPRGVVNGYGYGMDQAPTPDVATLIARLQAQYDAVAKSPDDEVQPPSVLAAHVGT